MSLLTVHALMSRYQSPFRPSDDSHLLPFPIGANALASVGLADLARILGNTVPYLPSHFFIHYSHFILTIFPW